MEWNTLTKEKTVDEFNRINFMDDSAFAIEKKKWASFDLKDKKYMSFREALIDIKTSFIENGVPYFVIDSEHRNLKARFDVEIGLKLFEMTSFGQYKMTLRDSSDNSIWWYISLIVVPDLVNYRWNYGSAERKEKRLDADRYYAKTRRIWLKSLWWFIFLSLQHDAYGNPDLNRTKEILKWITTDDITQIVDRAGLGYIPGLTRSIMSHYFGFREKGNKDVYLLRKVMKMNTARCKVQNPLLIGINEYVKSLFSEFV